MHIFRFSLNIPCGETNRLVLQSVTSTALFKNSTILNSHYWSFSKFLTKIILSGIPFCALRCWNFFKRSNISLIKKKCRQNSELELSNLLLKYHQLWLRVKKSVGGRWGYLNTILVMYNWAHEWIVLPPPPFLLEISSWERVVTIFLNICYLFVFYLDFVCS